jgi:hypothetical protein
VIQKTRPLDDFAIRRLSPTQAIEFLMRGGTPGGGSHPFYNDYTDLRTTSPPDAS